MSGGVQVIRIDDRDPDIGYSNGWSQGGNGNEYLSTTSRTNKVGATASVQFTGTKIMIYGTIDSTALGTSPVSLFSVDGGRATQFVEQQIGSGSQYQQKFYESDDLDPGPHQLVITISSVPSIRASFTFDYAEYYVSPDTTTSPPSTTSAAPMQTTTVVVQQSSSQRKTTSPAQSSGSASQSSSASQLSSASDTQSTTPSASLTSVSSTSPSITDISPTISTGGKNAQDANAVSGSKSSSPSTPVIVGVVVGVLALLILLFILFFVIKRRKGRRNSGSFNDSEANDPISRLSTMIMGTPSLNTSVTPFIPDPQHHADGFPTSTVSEYYTSNASVYGRTSSFEPSSSSSASAAGASDGGPSMSPHMPAPASTSYAIGAGYSKAAETRQEHGQIMEEDELEPYQPPPCYES